MGIPVMILGESGTGKSASLRNFDNNEVGVVNVANKPLPFKNKITKVATDNYSKVKRAIKDFVADGKKAVVIDDSQYLMANEFMRRATERGYDKFTEIAQNMWDLVNSVKELPDDVIVYFLTHLERDVNGNEKVKTIGKLLDEKITLEGMFTIVLKTNVTDGQYCFLTQNSGHDTVKSPIGMFPSYAVDNDLKYVDEKIRNYYEIGDFISDEEMKEIDEAAKNVDVIKEEKPKRGRRNAKKEEPSEASKEEEEEKPTRRRRADKDEATESVDGTDKEESKGRTRRSREEVARENQLKVLDAAKEAAGDEEEVELDKVDVPQTEKLPRRRGRRTAQEESTTPMMEAPAEEAEVPRRRRRRGTGAEE